MDTEDKLAIKGTENSEEEILVQSSYEGDRKEWGIKLSPQRRIVGSLIVVLAMASAMIVVARPMLAENHFSQANNYLQAMQELTKASHGQLREAITHQSFPLRGPLYQGRAAQFSQEDIKKAAAELGIQPERLESMNEMVGLLYWVFLARAEEELRQSIAFNHRNSTYHYQLGNIYERKGNLYRRSLKKPNGRPWLDKAIAEYERAIKCNPFMPHYHSALGKLFWDKAKGRDKTLIEGAISEFEEAVHCYPTKAGYRALLGRAYELTDRKEDALEEYKKALELDPDLSDPVLKEVRIWVEKLNQ